MRPFEGTHRNSMTRLKRHVSGDTVRMFAGWQPAHPRSWLVPAHSWGGGRSGVCESGPRGGQVLGRPDSRLQFLGC